jgi:hypothetical protein
MDKYVNSAWWGKLIIGVWISDVEFTNKIWHIPRFMPIPSNAISVDELATLFDLQFDFGLDLCLFLSF